MSAGQVLKKFEKFIHIFSHGGKEMTEKEAKEAAEKFAKEQAEREAKETVEKTGKEAGEDAAKQGAKEGVERMSKEMRSTVREVESTLGKTSEFEARSARVIGEGENARYLTDGEFKSLEEAEQTVKKYDDAVRTQETYGKADAWEWDEANKMYNPKEGGPVGREPISKAEFEKVTNADEVIKSAESEEFKSAQDLVDKYADVGGSKAAKETKVYEHPTKLGDDGQPLRLTEGEFEGLGMMERAYKEDNAEMFKAGLGKMGNAAKGAWNNPIGKKVIGTAAFFGVGVPASVAAVSTLATGNPMAGFQAAGAVYDTYGKATGAVGEGLGAVGNFIGEHPWVLALGAGALAMGVLGRGSILGSVAKLGIGAVAVGFLVTKGSELMGNMVADKEGTTAKLENALGVESDSSASTEAQNDGQNEVIDANTNQYVKVDMTTVDTSQYQQGVQQYSV